MAKLTPSEIGNRIIAVCPGAWLTFPTMSDRTTWRLNFPEDATAEEQAAATELLASMSLDAVPETISDRQFFQQLAVIGAISTDEALAAVATGTLPQALQGFVDSLPSDQKFAAKMLLVGATVFNRSHPMTDVLRQGMGWSTSQLDALWVAAAAL